MKFYSKKYKKGYALKLEEIFLVIDVLAKKHT